jgi:hypothetical protein
VISCRGCAYPSWLRLAIVLPFLSNVCRCGVEVATTSRQGSEWYFVVGILHRGCSKVSFLPLRALLSTLSYTAPVLHTIRMSPFPSTSCPLASSRIAAGRLMFEEEYDGRLRRLRRTRWSRLSDVADAEWSKRQSIGFGSPRSKVWTQLLVVEDFPCGWSCLVERLFRVAKLNVCRS